MVCDISKPRYVHVPDFHALAKCPFCLERFPVSHHDLKNAGRALDGSAEWVCRLCKGVERSRMQRLEHNR